MSVGVRARLSVVAVAGVLSRGLLAALLCTGLCGAGACSQPELPRFGPAPAFALRDHHGNPVTAQTLRGHVWIANFMFTSCPDVCPLLTSKLAGVRMHLRGDQVSVQYLSFTVDPATDTVEVLAKYAREHHADFADWRFLTGDVAALQAVIVKGFKQAIETRPGEAGKPANILHGSHFVLVDATAQVRGYYRSDERGLLELARDAHILVRAAEKAGLPQGKP